MVLLKAIKQSLSEFVEDDCPTMAAALAYYTVFSLPPLVFLLVTLLTVSLSFFGGTESAAHRAKQIVVQHAATILGNETIQQEIGQILDSNEKESRSWWRSLVGIAAVLIGATAVLSALQNSLNKVWRVKPQEGSNQAMKFLLKRLISLTMILGFGFILIVSFVVNMIIGVVLQTVGDQFGFTEGLAAMANHIVSFLVIACLLAVMYRYLPDARVGWRDVVIAAGLTSLLFSFGRSLLQMYFEVADPAAQLGSAAASLAAVLIWVYYSSMIMLLGAEFSRAWAEVNGRRILPEKGATIAT